MPASRAVRRIHCVTGSPSSLTRRSAISCRTVTLSTLTVKVTFCSSTKIEAPDFLILDSKAGVVRACGGNIPNRQNVRDTTTDQCFSFDGFEWKPMASLGKFSINSQNLFSNDKSLLSPNQHNLFVFYFENNNHSWPL